jgi:2-amino-4-hydroxy-6-hydroxymethyldihydropteridine diphosphokinase
MTRAFVSVGSNINPGDNVREALKRLSRVERILRISTVYMTEPLGRPEQSPYYNGVIAIQTRREPLVLKEQVLRRIEKDLGRERSEDKYAPRTIDLDLILYDDLVLKTDDLTLPDPQILQRPFLALPLKELEPALVIPDSGFSIEEVAAALSCDGMKPLHGYTELLRKEFCHECGHEKD